METVDGEECFIPLALGQIEIIEPGNATLRGR